MRELALFAGAGGGILGSKLLGWDTRCAVEIDPYCRRVLLARQRDEVLPIFPIWDDVRTFDSRPWRGFIDVVSGGFPCQDISSAGKGAGITGDRSSLFFEMLRIVEEVQPAFVFAENSPQLRTRGLNFVVKGLTRLGFVGAHGVLGAGDVGAPHIRKRMWIVAYSERNDLRNQQRGRSGPSWEGTPEPADNGAKRDVADSDEIGRDGRTWEREEQTGRRQPQNQSWWSVEPDVGRVAHGVAFVLGRLKAIGNGQVPLVAATAWQILAPLAIAMKGERQNQ